MVRDRRWASSTMRVGDAVHDAEIVLVGHRLGEHGQRPDRRLQLVADVGDEVGPHGVDAPPLADVLDRRHGAAAVQRRCRDDDGDPRRAVQLERLAALLTVAGLRQQALDGVVDEQPDVRARQRAGGLVAVVDRARSAPATTTPSDNRSTTSFHRGAAAGAGRRRGAAGSGRGAGGRGAAGEHEPGDDGTDDGAADGDERRSRRRSRRASPVTPGRSPRPGWRSGPRRRARASSR